VPLKAAVGYAKFKYHDSNIFTGNGLNVIKYAKAIFEGKVVEKDKDKAARRSNYNPLFQEKAFAGCLRAVQEAPSWGPQVQAYRHEETFIRPEEA